MSACRLKVNDNGTPVLNSFTINGVDKRPFIRVNSNDPLVIKIAVSSENPITSISIVALPDNAIGKNLGFCDKSPCEVSWEATSNDNGNYGIKADVEDSRGNKAIFQYNGDDSIPNDANEVDVIINIQN